MKVLWSEEAGAALVALEQSFATRYSPDKAAAIVEALVERVDRLVGNPQIGRAVPEYGRWQLRELVDNWNRVLYRLLPDSIEIVTIVPGRIPLPPNDPEND